MAGLVLAQLVISQPSIAEDKVELRPAPEQAPAVVQPAAKPAANKKGHPILSRVGYPLAHPARALAKASFPVRHPVAATARAFDRFCAVGKWSEKKGLTAALTLCGAIGNVATPAVVGVFR